MNEFEEGFYRGMKLQLNGILDILEICENLDKPIPYLIKVFDKKLIDLQKEIDERMG